MKPAEIRYSYYFDCERLAMYLAIKCFQHFIEGRQFHMLYNRSQAPDILILYPVESTDTSPDLSH